jgi:peptidoglycan/LPS O-acetylase OafA/YrhL
MKFRYDINALRALAVTAVVLFHYKINFVPGGFVGVDVFFVISGYLMTSIIMGRLAKGKFSIWDFYHDRANRIVPGLMGMCFVLLAVGYFFVEPAAYHYLGSTSISALLYFSNFRFWQATGYFDPQSDTKWLLHTWSLSVEWQFYLAHMIKRGVTLYQFSGPWRFYRFSCASGILKQSRHRLFIYFRKGHGNCSRVELLPCNSRIARRNIQIYF